MIDTLEKSYLLFDGDCGICSASAHYIQRRDKSGSLSVMPYQLADLPSLSPGLTEEIASRTVCFVRSRDNKLFIRSRAIFEITKHMGGLYPIIGLLMGNPIVALFCDPVYNLIAKNRAKISVMLGMNACALDKAH